MIEKPQIGDLVERAYQLAHSGECATYYRLRMRLKAEGHVQTRIRICTEGRAIKADLAKLFKESNGIAPRVIDSQE